MPTYTGVGITLLGKRGEVLGALERVQPHKIPHDRDGRPTALPVIPRGKLLIIELDQVVHKLLYVCSTFEGLQWLDEQYGAGLAIDITYYFGEDIIFAVLLERVNAEHGDEPAT